MGNKFDFEECVIGKIYEFTCKSGVSYIGKFIGVDTDSGKFVFNDILSVSMRPVQTPDGQMTMAPAMDLVGIFVSDPIFKIFADDMYLIKEVKSNSFVKMYEANISMFKQAKAEHNSDIVVTDKMPQEHDYSVQKPVK